MVLNLRIMTYVCVGRYDFDDESFDTTVLLNGCCIHLGGKHRTVVINVCYYHCHVDTSAALWCAKIVTKYLHCIHLLAFSIELRGSNNLVLVAVHHNKGEVGITKETVHFTVVSMVFV
ncbi:hypothetical protein NP493_97g02006 [Ridgeia piscesae]|uniref:Uncharacterized protein n=1 Tax=Ridgeia piscesae TaxID=27915 RepID=A0AAD9P856_RIDPI|nr:hypothetical protein NP493_97g02006 [Ridgeia piscesae]